MTNNKLFTLNSTNIFGSIFATICLFIIEIMFIAAFNNFIEDPFVAYCAVYAIFILIIYIKERKTIDSNIRNFKNDIKGKVKNIIIVTTTLLLAEFILNYVLIKLLGHGPTNNDLIIDALKNNNVFIFMLYSFILCPILEGLFFTYPYKNNKNKLAAYISMSIVFALMHITSATSLFDTLYLIPYLCMTFAFNYGFYKTNNVFVSIGVHTINNIIAYVLLFIM
jgi:membrane protease YdiL (CAAX protease family)